MLPFSQKMRLCCHLIGFLFVIFIAWLYGDVLGFMVDCEASAMQYDECEITVA